MSFRGRGMRSPFVAAGSGANYVYGSSNSSKSGSGSFSSVPPPNSSFIRPGQPGKPAPSAESLQQAFPISTRSGGTATSQFKADDNYDSAKSNSASYYPKSAKRKPLDDDDDEYFDDDVDGEALSTDQDLSSDTRSRVSPPKTKPADDDEEEDPLDAFMADIAKEAVIAKPVPAKLQQTAHFIPPPKPASITQSSSAGAFQRPAAYRADIEEEDVQESYYRFMEENPNAGLAAGDEEGVVLEYDQDGNPIVPVRSKNIEPLPPVDHSLIKYPRIEKNFYQEHEDIAKLSSQQVNDLKNKLGIKVTGASPPKPVASFGHFSFDEALMNSIRKSEFTQPTPIQAMAIPALLQGRDCIGIAKTGSGKTVAYLWPLLIHILDQPPLKRTDGPIALILAPTRELAQQIYTQVKRFGTKVYNVSAVCIAGGGNKHDQERALKDGGAEIIVCTPGRMIDLVKNKATNLHRVSYLVLDEADRMLDLGFESQVRSICKNVRPDRQTALFSATFKKSIEKLTRDVLNDPVRIVQGELGEANEDVTQFVKVFANLEEKWTWLLANIVSLTSAGSVLIFVTKKANSEDVANKLRLADHKCGLIHGDLHQTERDKMLHQFKKKELPILVATDVASRGLDIPSIKTVVNFDVARDIDTHTHRIGRTGRAGEAGTAYTLVTPSDKEFLPHLVRNLEGANQHVPERLMELAEKCSWFKKTRFKTGKGKQAGGRGLGFKDARSNDESVGDMIRAAKDQVAASGGESERASSASSSGSASTMGTDRHQAVKAVLQAKFRNQFKAASSADTGALPPPPPEDEGSGRKRKSRWE